MTVVIKGQHAERKAQIAARLEAMLAEIEGWDDDLRAILPMAQYARFGVLVGRLRTLLRRIQVR